MYLCLCCCSTSRRQRTSCVVQKKIVRKSENSKTIKFSMYFHQFSLLSSCKCARRRRRWEKYFHFLHECWTFSVRGVRDICWERKKKSIKYNENIYFCWPHPQLDIHQHHHDIVSQKNIWSSKKKVLVTSVLFISPTWIRTRLWDVGISLVRRKKKVSKHKSFKRITTRTSWEHHTIELLLASLTNSFTHKSCTGNIIVRRRQRRQQRIKCNDVQWCLNSFHYVPFTTFMFII